MLGMGLLSMLRTVRVDQDASRIDWTSRVMLLRDILCRGVRSGRRRLIALSDRECIRSVRRGRSSTFRLGYDHTDPLEDLGVSFFAGVVSPVVVRFEETLDDEERLPSDVADAFPNRGQRSVESGRRVADQSVVGTWLRLGILIVPNRRK